VIPDQFLEIEEEIERDQTQEAPEDPDLIHIEEIRKKLLKLDNP
jgi:hypothetical protein